MSAEVRRGETTADDGATIAWTDRGEGPPLVLVHGITQSAGYWLDIPDRLAETHRVVTVDLRGHGASERRPPFALDRLAADVGAVLDDLGLERPLLVGHSLGAMVLTSVAATRPVAGVVNVDQPLRLTDFAGAVRPLADALRGDGFSEVMNAVFATMVPDGLEDDAASLLAQPVGAACRPVVLGIWEPVIELSDEDLAALVDGAVAGIDAPYVAIHGSDPGAGYTDWLTERIPGAVVEIWDGGLHYPHLKERDRFVERVRELSGRGS